MRVQADRQLACDGWLKALKGIAMLIEGYLASLEMNEMILGIVALNMKNFASQIIQHVNGGGPLDDAGLAALKEDCVRSLQNTAAEGVPLEQEATALNEALIMFGQMIDDAVLRARTEGENRSGR
jgi:hypothetical protein